MAIKLENLPEIETLLALLVTEERFAYDYTKQWRFLCAKPAEHARLCELLGVPLPSKVRLKCKAAIPDKEGRLIPQPKRSLPK